MCLNLTFVHVCVHVCVCVCVSASILFSSRFFIIRGCLLSWPPACCSLVDTLFYNKLFTCPPFFLQCHHVFCLLSVCLAGLTVALVLGMTTATTVVAQEIERERRGREGELRTHTHACTRKRISLESLPTRYIDSFCKITSTSVLALSLCLCLSVYPWSLPLFVFPGRDREGEEMGGEEREREREKGKWVGFDLIYRYPISMFVLSVYAYVGRTV